MDINKLNQLLQGKNILVLEEIHNGKSSESYVRTKFVQNNGFTWETVVPYYIRRSGLFLETEEELAQYLESIKPYFSKVEMKKWADTERSKWEISNADVTKEFFFVLLSFKEETEFPSNDNPARRIQDIKDAGYTVASIPGGPKKKTKRVLLPIPLNSEMGYETFTPQFKARVIKLLKGINAFEARPTNVKGLIPDHKFSEVRWDKETKADNSMDMTDDEIVEKFQLLDNQRNQQKREVCRNCFQTGVRGVIYGIPFFYEGKENWDEAIPTVGKVAEKGCIGCAWYDIERWRSELIKQLNDK
ncbi:MAG: hypothetical protein K2H44_10035 [Muribaculaceae bacterium]|nr:hypothetical protein [Muribaculaceae bacterium]